MNVHDASWSREYLPMFDYSHVKHMKHCETITINSHVVCLLAKFSDSGTEVAVSSDAAAHPRKQPAISKSATNKPVRMETTQGKALHKKTRGPTMQVLNQNLPHSSGWKFWESSKTQRHSGIQTNPHPNDSQGMHPN